VEPDSGKFTTLRDDDWASLVPAVAEGSCVLLLGPGTVTGTLGGESLPAHIAFATFAKEKLADSEKPPPELELLDPARPGSIAQAAIARGADLYTLGRWIHEFYNSFEVDRPVLDDLAALSFPLTINTSPGTSVYDAFAEANPGTHKEHYNAYGREDKLMPTPTKAAPVVYHLFGIVDQPNSMILSDNDQLNFFVKVAKGAPKLPVNLTSSMRDDDHTLLFLGFDLADWQFRLLLHVLALSEGDRRPRMNSFAYDLEADPVDPVTADFYRSTQKIHFFRGELPGFAHELRRRVESVSQDTPSREEPRLAPAAPTVFISYASEDREAAERVAAYFLDHGIRPWLDKHDLEGGVRWDARIQRAIAEDVDYVVVLQSSSLLSKSERESYVNLEIRLAKQRELKYGPRGKKFLIPALLEGRDVMREDLREWQTVDLTTPDGLNAPTLEGLSALVRTIKRDRE